MAVLLSANLGFNKAFLRAIRELVKKHVASPAEVLIRQLNSKLRDWGQYRRTEARSVLNTYVETKKGTRERLDLMRIGDISIKRHVKVQAQATPYDRRYLDYFRRRWQRLSDRRKADRRHLSLVTAPW